MLAVVWTSTSLHLRLINSSTVCLVDIRVWQIMRVILQSGYVSLCICVCALAVCVVPVWPLPPFWSHNIHHSDSPTLLRLIHVHAHRRRKTFGAGSQVSRAEWTLICSNQQTVRLFDDVGRDSKMLHTPAADGRHAPFTVSSPATAAAWNPTQQLHSSTLTLTDNTTAEVSASMNLCETMQTQNSAEVSDKCSSCRSGCGAALMLETDRQSFVPFSQLVSIFSTAETTLH